MPDTKEPTARGSLYDHSLNEVEGLNPEQLTRAIMQRIDLRILPLFGLLYSTALMDSTNFEFPFLAETGNDPHHQVLGSWDSALYHYHLVSCLYFVPYIFCQLPSNIILRLVGARNWLTFCLVAWGGVQIAMAFVPSWGLLALCRILVGLFEAGLLSALVFITTTWYTRYEVQKRLAAFYAISMLARGFSASFAYTLQELDGKQGIAGWAWIFIIEGAITTALGIPAWFFIPEFPDKNDFLTSEQTELVLKRVEEDRGDSVPDEMTWRKLCLHLGDWKIWVYGLMFMCATMPAYSIGAFLLLVRLEKEKGVGILDLMNAPPYILAAISIMFFAWLSDKYHQRALFIAIQAIITTAGPAITAYSHPEEGLYYFGIFLSTAGSAGCITGVLAYSSNNVVTHTKRSVSTAITISFGGIGGIFATSVFRVGIDYPGMWATIGCQLLMLVLLAITTLYLRNRNKQAGLGMLAEPLEGQPGFFYTL